MSLFSHRAHAGINPSKSLDDKYRRTVIPPWFINTASLILMGLLVLLSLSIGVADFSWSGILQSLLNSECQFRQLITIG